MLVKHVFATPELETNAPQNHSYYHITFVRPWLGHCLTDVVGYGVTATHPQSMISCNINHGKFEVRILVSASKLRKVAFFSPFEHHITVLVCTSEDQHHLISTQLLRYYHNSWGGGLVEFDLPWITFGPNTSSDIV
jgi:hypothetical protein